MRSPPTWRLSSSGVPSAIVAPVVDHRDRARRGGRPPPGTGSSAASSCRPRPARRSGSHTSRRLCGSRPGRRLVEEHHRRRDDHRRGEVEAPAHAAGVGARGAVGRVGEVEALEQLAGALARLRAREAVERARPSRGSRGRSAGRRPPRTGRRGRSASAAASASRTTSRPATWARPPSGVSSVVKIRTAVVLPAPFGPSRPSTVPGLDLEVQAVERDRRRRSA